jgi:hypothetical protein
VLVVAAVPEAAEVSAVAAVGALAKPFVEEFHGIFEEASRGPWPEIAPEVAEAAVQLVVAAMVVATA